MSLILASDIATNRFVGWRTLVGVATHAIVWGKAATSDGRQDTAFHARPKLSPVGEGPDCGDGM